MQNYGQMIDKELIKELGLDQIHRDKLEGILDELAVILQPALSDKLEASLSDEQLDQFDQFLIKNDEMGAFSYLQQQIPNFTEVIKAVIADQKEILRSRVEMLIGGDPSLRATSEDQTILAAAPANPQPISPQPNPTNTTSPQLPSYSNQPASTPAPSESAPNTPPQIKIPDVNAPDGVPNIYEDSYLRSSFNQSAPSNPQPQTAPDTNPQAPAKPAPPTINPFVQSAGSYAQNPTQPVSPNPYPNSPQNPVDSLTDPYAPPRNVSSTPPPTTYSTGIQTNPQPAAPASYPPASHPLSSTQSTPNPGFPQANSVSQPSPNNTPNTPASVPNSTTQPAQPWQPPANQVNQPTQPTTPSYDYTNPATNPNHPLNSLKQ